MSFDGLDIQADQPPCLFIHVRNVRLRVIVEILMHRIPPVVAAHLTKACTLQRAAERLEIVDGPVVERRTDRQVPRPSTRHTADRG